jgi:hypothetical protein
MEMSDQTKEEVRVVIDNYLKAISTGSTEFFQKAFHREAIVLYPRDPTKQPVASPLESFIREVAQLISEHGRVEEIPRGMEIQTYRNVGAVKLKFELKIGDSIYEGTDFFNLVRVEGAWRITQKIYDMIPKTGR